MAIFDTASIHSAVQAALAKHDVPVGATAFALVATTENGGGVHAVLSTKLPKGWRLDFVGALEQHRALSAQAELVWVSGGGA